MSYMEMDNLYKAKEILEFRWCFAMEKLHGSSSHISWKDNQLNFFSGGAKHESFIQIFNHDFLKLKFEELGCSEVVIFGEVIGGKMQGMSATYGKEMKFVAFEVKIGESWLNLPSAEDIVKKFGLEFVSYVKCSTDLEELNKQRDADSVQAIRNGMGEGHMREGIVLRPPYECRTNNGRRVIAKHKRDEFRETKTPRIVDENKLAVLRNADMIADEWVTEMRLTHVLDKFPNPEITQTGDVIKAMVDDIIKEGIGEIVDTPEARKAINRKTALMFKDRLKNSLKGN